MIIRHIQIQLRVISHLFKIITFSLLLTSCKTNSVEYKIDSNKGAVKISIENKGEVNYILSKVGDTIKSSWPLRYPVFRFLKGDVNNDGQNDIAVGVIKRTRRDSIVRKRLFLFQVRNKAIIPLWLGSSLSHPLEDFAICKHDSITIIRSIEKEKDNRYLVAEYEWFGFGLSFREYLKREILLQEAQTLLDK